MATKTNQEKRLTSTEVFQEEEIDLFELISILNQKKKIVIFTTLVFFIGGILGSFFIKEKYKYEYTIGINPVFANLILMINPSNISISNMPTVIDRNDVVSILKAFPNSYKDGIIQFKEDNKNPKQITVSIQATKRDELETITKDIKEYLENHSLMKSKVKLLQTIISQQQEITKFIQNQERIINTLETSKNPSIGFDIYQSYLALKLRNEIFKFVENHDLFEYNYPPYPEKPESKKFLIIVLSLFSGLLLGIFLAILWDFIEKKNIFKAK